MAWNDTQSFRYSVLKHVQSLQASDRSGSDYWCTRIRADKTHLFAVIVITLKTYCFFERKQRNDLLVFANFIIDNAVPATGSCAQFVAMVSLATTIAAKCHRCGGFSVGAQEWS